jgi:hypothetical protein
MVKLKDSIVFQGAVLTLKSFLVFQESLSVFLKLLPGSGHQASK